ncbi:MAG TPA: DUF835 domain-containing protein, partial [Thermoplasmata archaeon]|nr:DUF835 domain-containing protein [Thermoplasmata archaeon]
LVAKPDPAPIGKTYKSLWPKIATALAKRSPEGMQRALAKGALSMRVAGRTVKITPDMVRFERKLPEAVALVRTPYGELYLDLRITPEIQAEAYAREVIRRIQQMRKDMNLDVDDYVVTSLKASGALAAALESQRDLVARETRSRILTLGDRDVQGEVVVEWNDVDGQNVTIGLTPLHMTEALREFTRLPGLSTAKAMLLFDAGYKSVAALRAASRGELAAIEGLDPQDPIRIVEALAQPGDASVPCPVCEAPVAKGARRCARCGEPVSGETVSCPRCNTPVPPGLESCPVCGLVLSVPSAPRPGPSRVACAACGEYIPVGSDVCPSCGARQKPPASPAPHPAAQGKPRLRTASTYLVVGEQTDAAYRLFEEALAAGQRGLCLTRVYPQRLRERYAAAEVSVLWLSNVGKEDAIRPKDLEKLSLAVEQFVAREHGAVLLDGVEYLVTNNNFLTVLRLVQAMRDQVAIHNGTLLISVSPTALESHQLTLLEREVDQVIGSTSAPAA